MYLALFTGCIEEQLSIPCELSVGLLRLDPVWDPLRNDPRFRALLEKYEVNLRVGRSLLGATLLIAA
jgi:hypothetical protein